MGSARRRKLRPPKRSADPWADSPPIDSGLCRNPEDPLAFWEWECQRWYFRESIHPSHAQGLAKPFWEQTQACALLRSLCNEHPARLLHPVFFLLREIHGYPVLPGRKAPGLRDRWKQEHSKALRNLKGIKKRLACLPPWAIRDAARARILKDLDAAISVAADPHPIVLVRTNLGPEGQEEETFTFRLESSAKTGRTSLGFEEWLNGRLFLLSEVICKLVGKGHYWPIVVELVRHFCPSAFLKPWKADADNVRARVNMFKRNYRPELPRLRKDLSCRVKHLLSHPTDIA